MALNIFISHAHVDAPLAEAVKTLLDDVFDNEVAVAYSSDQSVGGGIAAGANWLQWIVDEVRRCDIAIVMLTPESLNRPWLMWEIGAVSGVALGMETQRPIVPLLFRVSVEVVPGPLHPLQAVQGEAEAGMRRMVETVWDRIQRPGQRQLAMLLAHALPIYLESVQRALQNRAQALTEDGVQEWCERIDMLRRAGRSAEVAHIHRALLLAFAPPGEDSSQVPLDLRLHRRLGELYLDARRGQEAVAQFELALRLFGKDVFVLHKLALAHLEAGNGGEAIRTLDRIATLDPAAVTENPEVAGLKGRLHRQRWEQDRNTADLRAARDAYRAAMETAAESYYMAANVGELSLALGERDVALQAYDSAVATIRRSGERSVWSLATLATAAIVAGESEEALSLLGEIGALDCPPRDLETIRNSLRRLRDHLSASAEDLASWLGALSAGILRSTPVDVGR
ncbi:toll/interleukin-1 receptor domain-containing protein [Virgisporangium aurantiacum]|uniref:TIR domain-containing protein n=1 Tax=Virgisporangium aurantiacum TaxID=175570 RepID=A0A8J4E6W5_9ACTN|nr:toll/interleukin-1 receptor domain-containing protein [Virgisporangium aurantiacum]GIJ63639.1 hypothetical protein Vau01_111550 [Virgisporangium aurantiacum]